MTLLLCAVLAAGSLQAAPRAHLTFQAPEGWTSRPVASSMRVAEFDIPRAGGDAEDAELIIYYFGGQGGSPEANIHRWTSQVQAADGAGPAPASTDQRTVHGLRVWGVDVSGTYVAEVRPGASEHFNKPGFRLRAAVVETPGGPYYIKLTGPAKTVAAASPAYDQFLSSLAYSAAPAK
jgi:hypothetical protein